MMEPQTSMYLISFTNCAYTYKCSVVPQRYFFCLCCLFEAFDEPWKDSLNVLGSENHFGLFTVDGQAKYPLWDMVDRGLFKGLTRGGNPITKTFEGSEEELLKEVFPPPSRALTLVNH